MLGLLTQVSIRRTRLSSAASRDAALAAARLLLVEQGPQAVTLKAAARRIGKSHGTLLHHFGSAAELQSAVAALLAKEITEEIVSTVLASEPGKADHHAIIDLVFGAFTAQGGGALAAWMIANGDRAALNPVLEALRDLVELLGERAGLPIRERALGLILLALGDALMGQAVADALALPRQAAQNVALRLLAPDR
jgi:AcrR family transcriptional regulator